MSGLTIYIEGEIIERDERGVKPILDILAERRFEGGECRDKIVGKAAAMLFVYGGAKKVYGEVMSAPAFAFLRSRGVEAAYGTLAERIVNRSGDGLCPMETAVLGTDSPEEAYALLKALL